MCFVGTVKMTFHILIILCLLDSEAVWRCNSSSKFRRSYLWAVIPFQNSGGWCRLFKIWCSHRCSNYWVPTFSPLITTFENKKFYTFCYSLQTPIFFLLSSNKSFSNGFVNRSTNWFPDVQNSTLISLLLSVHRWNNTVYQYAYLFCAIRDFLIVQ